MDLFKKEIYAHEGINNLFLVINLEEGKKIDLMLLGSEIEIPQLFSRTINITVGEYFEV